MKKYDIISALSGETAKKVARDENNWMQYLDTASRLYKYRFKEQLLIYAQRPDATACASMEIWNSAMHCWVNRGAKGIALVDEDSHWYGGLKYVFDISDVHKARGIGRFPDLWEMRMEHEGAVLSRLEKLYGSTDKGSSFADRIREISGRIAAGCSKEIASDLEYNKEGSFLEELDSLNMEIRLRETLSCSIAYTVLKRCGIEESEIMEGASFPYIREFNTIDTLSLLGSNVSNLAKPILMEIGKAIRAYDREHGRDAAVTQNFTQKSLANIPAKDFNALKRESEWKKEELQAGESGERRDDYGTEIRAERGLPDTDVKDGRAAGGNADQIRTDAQELPEGTQRRDIHGTSPKRETEGTSADGSGAGGAEDGGSDRADEKKRGSDRTAQGGEPDALGSENEQHQAVSGGKRAGRTDLHLVRNGQITEHEESLEPDNGTQPLSGISLSELEHGILRFDAFMVRKRAEIAGFFLSEADDAKRAEYMKDSYKHKEYSEFNIGEERAGYYAEEDGLTLWHGTYLKRDAERKLSWKEISGRIAYYIENGSYLLPGESPQWEKPQEKYEQLSLFQSMEEQMGTITAAAADMDYKMPPAFSLPQEQIETILRSGGGRDNSRKRIYAKYQQGKTPEEMTEFLRNEYKTTGKGFDFEEHPVSVWFDEAGMSAGYGASAKEKTLTVMGWWEIEGHIRSMVECGAYMGANEVFLVDETERRRVSDDLYNFFRDGIGEIPESIPIQNHNYPESIINLCGILSTQEGRDAIIRELSHAKRQIESGEKQIQWQYVKKPEHLISEIVDLSTEKREYPIQDQIEVRNEDFITQDEIDNWLTGGDRFYYLQFHIYEHFKEGHDRKETIDFLKNEYGTGGSTSALAGSDQSDVWHDSKGVSIGKGRIGDPYAKVFLKWNAVEKRIGELIKADKYLTPKGKEAYARYKKEQAEIAMRREQERLEHGIRMECRYAIEKAVSENFDGYTLLGDAADGVIRKYGKERAEFVLANTIMHLSHDGRFSPDNKGWAEKLVPSADPEARDYIIASHPAVLNGFINQARRYIEHKKEIAAQAKEEQGQGQNDISEIHGGELDWHIVHDMDDDNGQPMEWSAKLPNGEFLWIDKETEGYAPYALTLMQIHKISVIIKQR